MRIVLQYLRIILFFSLRDDRKWGLTRLPSCIFDDGRLNLFRCVLNSPFQTLVKTFGFGNLKLKGQEDGRVEGHLLVVHAGFCFATATKTFRLPLCLPWRTSGLQTPPSELHRITK